MQIDVAPGSPSEQPTLVIYPTLLDQPVPRLLGTRREVAVAEKLHAMVIRGEINTRLKDFYELWLLSQQFRFDGATLSQAVRAVFRDRETAISGTPLGLTAPFGADPRRQVQWAAFIRKRLLEGAPREFLEAVEVVAGFLGPVVESLGGQESLDGAWLPGGPWRPVQPATLREPRATWAPERQVHGLGGAGARSPTRL